MRITVRPATPADATHLACFVAIASHDLALHLWEALRQPGQTLFEVGRSRALREDGSFSYRYGHMAEIDGAIAGTLIGYKIAPAHDRRYRIGSDENAPPLPAFVEPLVDLEALAPRHWYVNFLATYPEQRGLGVGKTLLAHADRLAAAVAAEGMAVVVRSDNEGALRLYGRCGYKERARRPVVAPQGYPHRGDWLLLTRT